MILQGHGPEKKGDYTMANTKLYPFSVQKHAHDIEYRRNAVFCELHDMEVEEFLMNGTTYDRLYNLLGELTELLQAIKCNSNGRVAYLTGKQYRLAKDCIVWAAERRCNRNYKGC